MISTYLLKLHLPFQEPVLVFFVILLIILLVPLIFNRLKIPSVIGLILAGTLVGPHGLNMIPQSQTTLFGTVGLLYIMFFAGLEINIHDFKRYKYKSLTFGAFTFFVPLIIGTAASFYLLGYTLQSSILLASMFSTHTLIAYPIISRLGLSKNKAVTITVGGTIITDTAALLLLTIITSSGESSDLAFWVKMIGSIIIFVTIVLVAIPLITRWFFRTVEKEGVIQYIFILLMVFAAGFAAELANIEPIIGAFLAGLALNRLIPHTSALMHRIEFTGNALFIPFFLINVGMLVNLKLIFAGTQSLYVALILIVVALGSKWLAAVFTAKTLKLTSVQQNLIFGLSSAHAAATIAIILVAFNLNLLDTIALNGTILLILVTCLVSSVITDKAGKKIILEQQRSSEPVFDEEPDRVLIPVANPSNTEPLIELGMAISKPGSVLYPLTVIVDSNYVKQQLKSHREIFNRMLKEANAANINLNPINRIDVNATSGIISSSIETSANIIIMGWNGQVTTKAKFFGSILDNVLESTETSILVAKLNHPLHTFKKILLWVPEKAHFEYKLMNWIPMVNTLTSNLSLPVFISTSQSTYENIKKTIFSDQSFNVHFVSGNLEEAEGQEISSENLFLVIGARPHMVTYSEYRNLLPGIIERKHETNFIIIFP